MTAGCPCATDLEYVRLPDVASSGKHHEMLRDHDTTSHNDRNVIRCRSWYGVARWLENAGEARRSGGFPDREGPRRVSRAGVLVFDPPERQGDNASSPPRRRRRRRSRDGGLAHGLVRVREPHGSVQRLHAGGARRRRRGVTAGPGGGRAPSGSREPRRRREPARCNGLDASGRRPRQRRLEGRYSLLQHLPRRPGGGGREGDGNGEVRRGRGHRAVRQPRRADGHVGCRPSPPRRRTSCDRSTAGSTASRSAPRRTRRCSRTR